MLDSFPLRAGEGLEMEGGREGGGRGLLKECVEKTLIEFFFLMNSVEPANHL